MSRYGVHIDEDEPLAVYNSSTGTRLTEQQVRDLVATMQGLLPKAAATQPWEQPSHKPDDEGDWQKARPA